MNNPRQVAQTFSPVLNVPSTVARSSVKSTTFAERKTESLVEAGRSNLIAYSAVTVHGARSAPARFIRAKAAVQLQWQSSNVPMTPPFSTPSKASYFFSGFHSATTSPFFGKLRICSPSGFAGPQPQHALFGAYFSWSDLSFIVEISQAAQPRSFCQRVPPANSQRWIGFSEDDAKPNRRRRSIFPLCDSICRFIPRVQTSLDRDAIHAQRRVSAA